MIKALSCVRKVKRGSGYVLSGLAFFFFSPPFLTQKVRVRERFGLGLSCKNSSVTIVNI
jgi:hypothetical protein